MELINYVSKIICWFSGGVTSAIACKLAIELFGKENCRVIFMDTYNEDDDTYRFKNDCEKWYGINIETITIIGKQINTRKGIIIFNSIDDVWNHYLSLNVASGAICSSVLKRDLRQLWEKKNDYSYQVFGFDAGEPKRAKGLTLNYPKSNPIYPLLMMGYSKKDAINILNEAGIKIPITYNYGFLNNNCFKTGCIQGGIGYWQKMEREFLPKFDRMASKEHYLTNKKGKPVTMLKDQSKEAKLLVEQTGNKSLQCVFLKPHPDYPHIKDISIMKGREPKPLTDCNGFCGIDDLIRNPTELEINFEY
ncbi:phosphoadenosine phosphosulfate reductase family protein [Candidatus Pacearchaeota archaeon]|nr:phosphoadenosine phosphosulfate reductase family protein [Candidatus Pacearchaeota archaeon]